MNTTSNLNQEAEWDTQQQKVAPVSMTHPFEHLCFSGLHRHYRNIVLLLLFFLFIIMIVFFPRGIIIIQNGQDIHQNPLQARWLHLSGVVVKKK